MEILLIQKADVKTFKLLKGHYKYAEDKNHFYNDAEIIEGFTPILSKKIFDTKKRVKFLQEKAKKYELELIE